MDVSEEKTQEDLNNLSRSIPVLSEYSKALEVHAKRRYLQKISILRVDPASIASEEFDPECFLPQLKPWICLDILSWRQVITPSSSLRLLRVWKPTTRWFLAS